MNFFEKQHQQILAAGQHADVCLISTADGWVAMQSCADNITPLQGTLRQVTTAPDKMPALIASLQAEGKSVALLEWWSPSLSIKPKPTLILRLAGKSVDEDWI